MRGVAVGIAFIVGCGAQAPRGSAPLPAPSASAAPSSTAASAPTSPRQRGHVIEIWMAGGVCARFENGSVQCAILERTEGAPWRPRGRILPEWSDVAGIAGRCGWRADGTMRCPGERECASESVVLRGVGDAYSQHGRACLNEADGSIVCTDPIDCVSPERLRGVAFAMSKGQLCARLRDGNVSCADRNMRELVPIPAAKNALALRGTHWESCALLPDGKIRCWPTGNRWESENSRKPPAERRPYEPIAAPVEGIDDAVSFDLDDDHACAIMRDRTVRCWGENGVGQLGSGASGERSDPVQARGLTSAVEIRVSGTRSCARASDGTVHCWGANRWGEIDRSGLDRASPTHIAHVAHTSQIAMAGATTCALLESNEVVCWGCAMAPRCGLGLTADLVRREMEAARKACGEPTTIAWAP